MAREPGRGRGDGAVDPTLAQKKRARHRLVGAIALCLLAVLLIPLILEAEPRQKPREVPLEIAPRARPVVANAGQPPAQGGPGVRATDPASGEPAGRAAVPGEGRSTVKPVEAGAAGAAPSAAGAGASAATGSIGPAPSAGTATPSAPTASARDRSATPPPAGQASAQSPPHSSPQSSAPAPAQSAPQASAQSSAQTSAGARATESGKVDSKTQARTTPPRPDDDPLAAIISRTDPVRDLASAPRKEATRRYLVQVGAYSSIESARAVSDRVVSSGLRPYQETVRTDKGEWIRVRIGPFENREAAEQALRNLKAAGVSAALMTL